MPPTFIYSVKFTGSNGKPVILSPIQAYGEKTVYALSKLRGEKQSLPNQPPKFRSRAPIAQVVE